jgi:hypothetical protein
MFRIEQRYYYAYEWYGCYPQYEYSYRAPSSITIFAKNDDKFVNQQTLKYRDNLTNLMVKIVEMDENVTLKAQLEEECRFSYSAKQIYRKNWRCRSVFEGFCHYNRDV